MQRFKDALAEPDGPKRTAAVAAWLQSLFEESDAPVLVGGAAVELYTAGAYTSGDLDFVGRVAPKVAVALQRAGFVRKGRHWVHEQGELFLEFPSASLDEGHRFDRVVFDGWSVVVLALEELVVDRLCGWKFWRSEVDGLNAAILAMRHLDVLDLRRLGDLAEAADIPDAYERLRALLDEGGAALPSNDELQAWAEDFP